ncbi:MAG: hypothetical protein J6U13_01535 [Salinivirgaceae bacterium]|nr:hypothetical protein [Salinivirgaceae bacterium]
MKRIFLLAAVLFAAVAQVAAQNSFAYQAVIRNNGEVISNKDVALRITLLENNTSYYQETQKVKTNEYGNISINVGEGAVVSGSFSSVPWESLNVMMKLEVDAAGGSDFVELGSVQIKPAPYALYAAKAPTAIQPAASSTEPIFAVKNSKGEIMFAVFEDGVKVYVNLDEDGSKAAKSSFAVAGRSASKGEVNLLTVDDGGTVVYVDEDGTKAAKSRFAVASVNSKAGDGDLLAVNTEGSTFYVGEDGSKAAKSRFAVASVSAKGDAETLMEIDETGTVVYVDEDGSKAAKSRFAVASVSSKGGAENMLTIDNNGSTFYVDEDGSKAAKSRFAVASVSSKGGAENMLTIDNNGSTFFVDDPNSSKAAKSRFAVASVNAKGGEQVDVLTIDAKNSTFYFDNTDEGKAAKSRFAVAGRGAKSADDMFTVDNAGTVVYIDDPNSSKAAKSRFAVAGRGAKGGDNYLIISDDSTRFYINDASETNTGFAVVGKTTSNALFGINKDSVNVKNSMYVTGEVQTASGKVTKMADVSMPKYAYISGSMGGGYNFTYYKNNVGEYFELSPQAKDDIVGSCVVLKDGRVFVKGATDANYVEKEKKSFGLFYVNEITMGELQAKYNLTLHPSQNEHELHLMGSEPWFEIATYYNNVTYLNGDTPEIPNTDNALDAVKSKLTTLAYVLAQFDIDEIGEISTSDNYVTESVDEELARYANEGGFDAIIDGCNKGK